VESQRQALRCRTRGARRAGRAASASMRQHRWSPSWRHRVVAAPRRQTRGCRAWSTARRPYRGCCRRREPFQDGGWLGQRLPATCGGGSRVSCWVSACRSVQVWTSGASGCRGHRRAVCGRRQRRLGVCRCLSRRRRRSHRRSRRRRERLRCSVVLLQHEPRYTVAIYFTSYSKMA
jgi:hypothetical protein